MIVTLRRRGRGFTVATLKSALATAAGCAAAWFSYGFGERLGGPLMGVVAALNAAVMGSLLVSAVLDLLGPRKPN